MDRRERHPFPADDLPQARRKVLRRDVDAWPRGARRAYAIVESKLEVRGFGFPLAAPQEVTDEHSYSYNRRVGEFGTGCLDEDEVVAFVAGDLLSERRAAVIAHVDGCDTCRSLAATLAQEDGPSPPAPERFTGETLIDGRFRLGKPLGKGAMGTVFRAHDERLGSDVALKLVKRESDAKSFARELHAGRRVTHPNVCRVHDAGSIEGYD